MGVTAMMVGGTVGIAAKAATNNLMKISLRRDLEAAAEIRVGRQLKRKNATSAPWEYVLGAGVGAYVGNKIPQWEAKLVEDINMMRADRNMPPASRVGGYVFGSSITDSKPEEAVAS